MKTRKPFFLISLLASVLLHSLCATGVEARQILDGAAVRDRLSHLAPAVISADTTRLGAGDRAALRKLVRAAAIVDDIYIRQVWIHNERTLDRLRADTARGSADRLRYFHFNMGPWSRADGYAAFLPEIPRRKPLKANLYPEGLKRNSWGTWFLTLNDAEQKKAMGPYHVLRWDIQPGMKTVPYSEEYRDLLVPAAELLREAASLASDSSMRQFLRARADAFLSNDYRESERLWLSAGGPLDVTIGPYDPTLDELFFYKTGFEAYVAVRNEAAEKQVRTFSGYLDELNAILPLKPDETPVKTRPGTILRVADAVSIGGGAKAGYLGGALDYPVDTAFRNELGDKKVIFKNIQKVKFDSIQVPMAGLTIASGQAQDVTFGAFFDHMLMHEVVHALGPRHVRGTGGTVTVRDRLAGRADALEEAKADMAGLWALQHLINKGLIPKKREKEFYATHLSSMVRALRFGMVGAAGEGTAIEYNYLKRNGAFGTDPASGLMTINMLKFKETVPELLREILSIQASGDADRCESFFRDYAFRPPEFESIARRVDYVPYAIEPVFPLTD